MRWIAMIGSARGGGFGRTALAWITGLAAATAGPGLAARPAPAGRTVHNAVWGISLQVPGYEPVEHPLRERSDFVLAATSSWGACRLNVSLFAATAREEATPEACREGGVADPDALTARDDATLVEEHASPVAYSLFDRTLASSVGTEATFHELYGYFARGDVCFALHVSSGGCDAFPRKAMTLLRSVKLGPDTGATPEILEFARRRGGDPRDWRLHRMAAEAYLGDEARRSPARARRFFDSALRLGGKKLAAADRAALEQGVGETWLMEDDGEDAIPPLKNALQAADRPGEAAAPERRQAIVYDLARAAALMADVDASCDWARRWLAGKNADDLRPAAKTIRRDPQMENLAASDCYRQILVELGLK
jgi:hypothetical protein